jgi:hypothetical protein
VKRYVERKTKGAGKLIKQVHSFKQSEISNWQSGGKDRLPLAKVESFVTAFGLNPIERVELVFSLLEEQQGGRNLEPVLGAFAALFEASEWTLLRNYQEVFQHATWTEPSDRQAEIRAAMLRIFHEERLA